MEYMAYANLGDPDVTIPIKGGSLVQKFRRAVMRLIALQGYSERYPLLEHATRFWLEHCNTAPAELNQEFRHYFDRFTGLDAKCWSWIWWRLNVPYSISLHRPIYDAQARTSTRKADQVYSRPQNQRPMAMGTRYVVLDERSLRLTVTWIRLAREPSPTFLPGC